MSFASMRARNFNPLKACLSKLDLDPSFLAHLELDCVWGGFNDRSDTRELNTFVLQKAAFYRDNNNDSRGIFDRFCADFKNWRWFMTQKTSEIFIGALIKTLYYRGIKISQCHSIAEPDVWSEEELEKNFWTFSSAFQEEIVSKKLLPEDILSSLESTQQGLKVKDIENYNQEDDRDTDDSETDDEKLSINDASILKSDESGNLNRPKEYFLARFAEVWRSEDDYTGELFDSLDYKIKEFKWIMNILEIKTDRWSDCLQYILRKQAKQFARDTFTVEGWTFDQMVEALKDHFETAERKQYLRSVWTKITFNSVENENPTKCKSEVLQILIARLRKCQYALGQEYTANVHIVDCFLRACRHEPELAVAYGTIPKNFEAACAVFHQALEGKTSYQSTASVITDESSQCE